MSARAKRAVIVIVAVLAAGLLMKSHSPLVEVDFATSATVRFHYLDKAIDVKVTDPGDLEALKEILRGRSYPDSPSCGFTIDTSVTFTGESRSVTLCPACDGCSTIGVGMSGRYFKISEQQRKRLDKILAKYGMTFPCV